ncbi:MAG: hypothetical protein H6906_11040 [Hyphomicrobiales bacterium]|nr:hypothetical protein [Hyphomicrobiales bacterium]
MPHFDHGIPLIGLDGETLSWAELDARRRAGLARARDERSLALRALARAAAQWLRRAGPRPAAAARPCGGRP